MPLLTFQTSKKLSSEESSLIASKLTDLTQFHLKKKPHLTAVTIHQLPTQDWFIGANSLKNTGTESFSLRIGVTKGTNSPEEIKTYIEAVYTFMSQLFKGTREESYIIVDEIPSQNWGYGGRTQHDRMHNP